MGHGGRPNPLLGKRVYSGPDLGKITLSMEQESMVTITVEGHNFQVQAYGIVEVGFTKPHERRFTVYCILEGSENLALLDIEGDIAYLELVNFDLKTGRSENIRLLEAETL